MKKKKTNLFAVSHQIDNTAPVGTEKDFQELIEQLDKKTIRGETIGIEATSRALKSFDDFMKQSEPERKKIVAGMNPEQLFLYKLFRFCRDKDLKPVPLQSQYALSKIKKYENAEVIFGGFGQLFRSYKNKEALRKEKKTKVKKDIFKWPLMEKFMLRRILRLQLDHAAIGFSHIEPMLQNQGTTLANPETYKRFVRVSIDYGQGPERARHIRKLYSRLSEAKRRRKSANKMKTQSIRKK